MGDRPILILGATGGFGGAVLAQALARGIAVRALARNAHEARGRLGAPVGLEWVTGDGRDAASILRAAQGASAIFHGIDLPSAERALLPAIAANVAAAARATGIPVIFPGSVLALGPGGAEPFGEDAAMAPACTRGRIEVEATTLLAQAPALLVLRAGWYFGPGVARGPGAELFAGLRAGTGPGLAGDPGRPQAWSFLPDLARAALDLLARGWQGTEVVHGPALPISPGDLAGMIARAAGHPGAVARHRPWWQVRLRALVDPAAREVIDQRYLWDGGAALAAGRLPVLLPDFMPTPAGQAIALSLGR